MQFIIVLFTRGPCNSDGWSKDDAMNDILLFLSSLPYIIKIRFAGGPFGLEIPHIFLLFSRTFSSSFSFLSPLFPPPLSVLLPSCLFLYIKVY